MWSWVEGIPNPIVAAPMLERDRPNVKLAAGCDGLLTRAKYNRGLQSPESVYSVVRGPDQADKSIATIDQLNRSAGWPPRSQAKRDEEQSRCFSPRMGKVTRAGLGLLPWTGLAKLDGRLSACPAWHSKGRWASRQPVLVARLGDREKLLESAPPSVWESSVGGSGQGREAASRESGSNRPHPSCLLCADVIHVSSSVVVIPASCPAALDFI